MDYKQVPEFVIAGRVLVEDRKDRILLLQRGSVRNIRAGGSYLVVNCLSVII
ncbi:hypothetical protein KJ596_02710 [Patescibacteria group bacterium]|nr:hypothetical protein [Patescibacteria group bacterium]